MRTRLHKPQSDHIGTNQSIIRRKVQPKLAKNKPGDLHEQEADHVAEQVANKSDSKGGISPASPGGIVQKKTLSQTLTPHIQLKEKDVQLKKTKEKKVVFNKMDEDSLLKREDNNYTRSDVKQDVNRASESIDRTGYDPNSAAEKAYRTETVKEQLKNGEKLHNIHFVYKSFVNTNGDTGDLTYSYRKEYDANKEYIRETSHHKGQRVGLTYGIGDRFDPNEPKKVEKKKDNGLDVKDDDDRAQTGKGEDDLPPKPQLTQYDLDNILLNGGSIFNLIPSSPYFRIDPNKSNYTGTPKNIRKQLSKFDFKKVKIKAFLYYDTNFNIYYLSHEQREIVRKKLMQDLSNLVGSKIKFEVWFTRDTSKSTGALTGYIIDK